MRLEENKALIQKWLEAWINNDPVQIENLFAPEYTVNDRPIGIEGVKQSVHFLHFAFSDISAESNEIVAEGDKVVLRWTVRGKGANLWGYRPLENLSNSRASISITLSTLKYEQIMSRQISCRLFRNSRRKSENVLLLHLG